MGNPVVQFQYLKLPRQRAEVVFFGNIYSLIFGKYPKEGYVCSPIREADGNKPNQFNLLKLYPKK